MASFDFVEATSKGYEFSWYERSYLLRAAMPVILIRLICIFVVGFMQVEDQHLLSGLLFMPAHIAEALYMISLVRYVAFREPLFDFTHVLGVKKSSDVALEKEVEPEGVETKIVQNISVSAKERIFKAGVAIYLLIKIIQLGLSGLILDYSKTLDSSVTVHPPEQNAVSAIIVLTLTAGLLWAFRLLWLYIPVALGYSARGFLLRIKGMMSSLSIFATWFVCYFPVMILFYGIFEASNLFLVPDSILQGIVHYIIRAFAEIVVVLVQVVAMTYGYIEVLTQNNKKKK